MKGDFSRIRFNAEQSIHRGAQAAGPRRSGLGRQRAVLHRRILRETINADVIGQYGGPAWRRRLRDQVDADNITIGPGRYYVNGILVRKQGFAGLRQPALSLDPA